MFLIALDGSMDLTRRGCTGLSRWAAPLLMRKGINLTVKSRIAYTSRQVLETHYESAHRLTCIASLSNFLQGTTLHDSSTFHKLSSQSFCGIHSRNNLGTYSFDQVRCLATRVVPNQKSKEYLTSIGLDCDRLQESRPTVLKQDVRTLQQHVNLLESLGLTKPEIVDIIYKEASFLRKDAKSVYELVDYLKHTGLSDKEVANIFQRAPRFFSAPETVIGNVEYMKYLDATDKNICYILIYTPSLFYRVQGGVERVAAYLKKILTEEKFTGDQNIVIRYIMRNDPTLFIRQVSELERNIKFLREYGYHGDDLVSIFRYCPSSIRISTEFLVARFEYLQKRLSLTDERVRDLIRRQPQLLHASEENIQSHIDVVLELGFTTEDIVKTPRIFARNVESIKTRYEELTAVGFKPNLGSFIYSKEKHASTLHKFRMKKIRLARERNRDESLNDKKEESKDL